MLHWLFRAFLLILDFLLLETAIAGVPGSILGQIEYLNTLGNETLVRSAAVVLALGVAALAIGPTRLGEWRRAIATGRAGVSDRGNTQEPEETRGSGDYRSVTSHGQTGGQIAWNITNEGPQPRQISQSAGDALVRELQKRDPEQFQISWMQDAESGELGTMLQDLLQQGGWQMTMQVSGAMLSGGPPRGVLVETTKDSEAIDTFVSWLRQVNLNPQVNREEHRYGILTRGFDDSPPPPVHLVVGVLPR